jgi:hypothetical protein
VKRGRGKFDIKRAGEVALMGDHSLTLAVPPPTRDYERFEKSDWELFGMILEVLADAGVNVRALIDYDDVQALTEALHTDMVDTVAKWDHYDMAKANEWDVEEFMEGICPLPEGYRDWPISDEAYKYIVAARRILRLEPFEEQSAISVAHTIAGIRVAKGLMETSEERVIAVDMAESLSYQSHKLDLKGYIDYALHPIV